ncbi:MAG: putative Cytochrome oxidase assembly precursor [Acidobacteriales bacterium]|nr:putative Cytochrome oxidase assembly precursor [Terriglobales bacterium]
MTSNDAGLAVPDWPTSFGSFYKIPPMVGGVKYEHGHRMIAQFVGFLTIILAIWTQRVDRRRNIRILGWTALALVITQGILGGLTVKMLLPWYVSTGHAMLAQTFFSLTILMSIFSSRRWLESPPKSSLPDSGTFGLRNLSLLALLAVYMQLFLGAAFRHGGMHFLPHIIGAAFATVILLWASIRALTGYANVRPIRAAASAILGLLFLQLVLGFGAYLTRVEWGKDAAQPRMSMVATTVAHVAIGALLLAHCFMLAVQAYRHLSSRAAETSLSSDPKAVTA